MALLMHSLSSSPSKNQKRTPSGTLVFIDSSYKITVYPPDPYDSTPVAVRPISFLHLSGLTNPHVLQRLPSESWLRIVFRVLAPYMINDHFAANYPRCLQGQQASSVTWVIMGQVCPDEEHGLPKKRQWINGGAGGISLRTI
jgi:hypothetical protein